MNDLIRFMWTFKLLQVVQRYSLKIVGNTEKLENTYMSINRGITK